MTVSPPDVTAQIQAKLLEGFAAQQQGLLKEAELAYRGVLALDPRQFDALQLLGVLAAQHRDFAAAVDFIRQAITVNPTHAGTHYNLGYALEDLKQYDDALASYDRAIALQPTHAVAYNNRGSVLNALGRSIEALASFDKAIALEPGYAEAHQNRGTILSDLGRYREAIAAYDEALRLAPDYPFLHGTRLYIKRRICDWSNAAQERAALEGKIARQEPASSPWPTLALTDSVTLQRTSAARWVAEQHPSNPALGPLGPRKPGQKIRLGYFSPDFRAHPVAFLSAAIFEGHDRSAFETYAFSYGPDTQDAMRRRLENSFDRFIDVRAMTDDATAALARTLGIDIAIDLAGYTTGARAGIFALRPAPLQVSYLGYAGTTGAGYMDYLIADEVAVPAENRPGFTEQLAYLPHSFVAGAIPMAGRSSRAAWGLPDTGFVFCCFNNTYKITPEIFDVWMRILLRVPHSMLWLFEDNADASANLRKEAQHRGVSEKRLVFAPRLPSREAHLSRYSVADLFLDTAPYGAHATALDALAAGVPVLTCAGQTLAARTSASFLHTLGLVDMIVGDTQSYADTAVQLATTPARLIEVKDRLLRNHAPSALFNAESLTVDIERAYKHMFERHMAGLPPAHFSV